MCLLGSWHLKSVDLSLQISTGSFVSTEPEGYRADCLNSHSCGRAEGSANNSVLYESTQWITGNPTECTPPWTVPMEEYSVAPPNGSAPVVTPSHHSSEMDLGASIQVIGVQILT